MIYHNPRDSYLFTLPSTIYAILISLMASVWHDKLLTSSTISERWAPAEVDQVLDAQKAVPPCTSGCHG